jgi:hypothetical protein
MLSGPNGATDRNMSHEFHLLGDQPIAAIELATRQRWQPARGLSRLMVVGAPQPAATAAARLTQMRQITRAFTAYMDAKGSTWELRLLPQPLLRYGDDQAEMIDGALFAYVWTTGTDPELMLLLECRQLATGPAWHFAPLQFTNRALWLEHNGREVWRLAPHEEPAGHTTLLYTTGFVRTFPLPAVSPAAQQP